MLNSQMFSKFATSAVVLSLSSGTLVLALNPAVNPLAATTPVVQTVDERQVAEPPQADVAPAVDAIVAPQVETQPVTPSESVNVVDAIHQNGIQYRQLTGDDYQRDWKQAGQNVQLTRKHFVRLGVNGTLYGRLSILGPAGESNPVRDTQVTLVDPRGSVLGTTFSGPNGEFLFQNLAPGTTGLLARGTEGLMAYSFQLLPAIEGAPAGIADLQLNGAAVPPQDIARALTIIDTNVPHNIQDLKWSQAANVQVPDGANRGGNAGDLTAVAGTALSHHRLHLQPDGSLIGRMRILEPDTGRPLRPRDMSAFLIQGGNQLAGAAVNPDGTFSFPVVQPGIYSFVTAGLDGFAAFAIEVVAADQTVAARTSDSDYSTVSLNFAETIELDVCPINSTALETFQQMGQSTPTTPTTPTAPANLAGGTGGGGTGGGGSGGGSGGGGGGLGTIAGLAGLGVGTAALVRSNRDNPAPATPIIP